jgi:hypothetical protein
MAKVEALIITADTRLALLALKIIKPFVYLRLVSVDHAAYLVSRLVRLRVG